MKYAYLLAMVAIGGAMGWDSGVALAQSADSAFTVQVSSQKMALAVAPLQGSGLASSDVDKILQHSLELTGLFRMIPSGSFLPGLSTEKMAVTNYDGWYSSGASLVIKAEVKGSGNNMTLDLGLFNAETRAKIDIPYGNKSVSPTNYRNVVYAFVNAVVKYLTGEPGFAGQTLLAVNRDGRGKTAHVVKLKTDGSDVSRVTRSSAIEMLPAWGASGSILLTSYAKGNPDLYVVSGGAGHRVSAQPGMNSGAAYCAGNGRIALTISKDGDAEIYTMNADGSGMTRLTTNRAIDTSPTWSPDCSKIAFVSDRGGNPQIYTMNADGSNVKRVTMVGKYNTNPAWGKTGFIAFSARDDHHNLDIFIIREDGSDLQRITQDQGKNDKPTWSPDGRYLAFSSTRDGGSRIYIATADGRSQAAATTSGWYENPVWGH